MAKGNSRKRANGKTRADIPQLPQQLPPLMQAEAQYFNELVESSNAYSGLLTQKAQYENVVKQLQNGRKKVQKDEIKLPVDIVLIPKVMTYQENDKKKVLEMFDLHIKIFQEKLNANISQLEFSYENFAESGIRNKEFLARRFEKAIVKNIVPERQVVKGEDVLFEAEFADMMKDPKKVTEFKKAKQEAIKRNTKKCKPDCKCESCKTQK
jgi:hypothetical protein